MGEREKMQKPPQIIVIPQSMLAGQKSLLRLAPSPMNRNSSALLSTSSPSPLLSSAAISPMLSSNPRPVAAVVGSKRPAPTLSPQPKELLLDIKEEAEEQGRRPDRPGQEESSNRLDGEAARRRSSSPAGEPRSQRPTLEDQHPAPDGERQPSAAEQRAASQTLPPLHSPSIPSSLPPALLNSHQPSHSPVHR